MNVWTPPLEPVPTTLQALTNKTQSIVEIVQQQPSYKQLARGNKNAYTHTHTHTVCKHTHIATHTPAFQFSQFSFNVFFESYFCKEHKQHATPTHMPGFSLPFSFSKRNGNAHALFCTGFFWEQFLWGLHLFALSAKVRGPS